MTQHNHNDPDWRAAKGAFLQAEKDLEAAASALAVTMGVAWAAPGYRAYVEQRRAALLSGVADLLDQARERLMQREAL